MPVGRGGRWWWWCLALSLALLALPTLTGAARVSSSLSTTHHVHHFHNKHGTAPIAINRMPFLTRGGHVKRGPSSLYRGPGLCAVSSERPALGVPCAATTLTKRQRFSESFH
ncbi:hypothetical protein AAFF_G00192390 [Aldrovandia affinis]|uniref:Secreted protein n=1 Tax=Aldrovandia affinis TaxID=143900 RepID=A0AAD7R044_9TELE|nr:hypothetical protein AAFF_G00192390 [Aldrovandia affinis]